MTIIRKPIFSPLPGGKIKTKILKTEISMPGVIKLNE